MAISRACWVSSCGMCSSMVHPTRRRENKSRTPARYSQPSSVQTPVMSTSHLRLGASALKSRSNRLHTERGWASGCVVCARRRGIQTRCSHQPRHSVAAARDPLRIQFVVNARTDIGLPTCLENATHLNRQFGVHAFVLTATALAAPGIIAAAGYTKGPTHKLDTELAH